MKMMTIFCGLAAATVFAAGPEKGSGPKLRENTPVEWRVRMPKPGGFIIRTGRPCESFSINTRPDEQSLFVWKVE